MVKIVISLLIILLIAFVDILKIWISEESHRLKRNNFVLQKELQSAKFIEGQALDLSKQMKLLKELPSKKQAKSALITFFDDLAQHRDLELSSTIKESSNLLTLNVKVMVRKIDVLALKELFALNFEGGMVEITALHFESNTLELMMRWSMPFKEGVQ